jgi:hypothetical protein
VLTGTGIANVERCRLIFMMQMKLYLQLNKKSVCGLLEEIFLLIRGGVTLLSLHGSGDMRLSDSGHTIANNSTSDMSVLRLQQVVLQFLKFPKQANYTHTINRYLK